MADRFEYSVFLSFHADDRPVAEDLAAALKKKNLRVCFDGSDVRDGETRQQALERGLRTSRTLVLGISTAALEDGWPLQERRSAVFRDPGDARRRFVPVILDDCLDVLPDNIRQYGFIDYRKRRKKSVGELIAACRAATKADRKRASEPSYRIATPEFGLGNVADVADVAETFDGSRLLIACGREVDVYNLGSLSYEVEKRYDAQKDRIKCVALSPDGTRLALGLENSLIQILHLRSGTLETLPTRHEGDVVSIEWDPEGRRLASGANDSPVRIWDLGLSRRPRELCGHSGGIGQALFCRDGVHAVSASYDNTVKLWDANSGECLSTFGNHGAAVNSVALLPDGRHLLTGSDECTVRLWDLDTRSCLVSMEGHRDTIWRVAYSAESRIAASGSWDNTVRLWEVWSGKCLQVIKYPDVVNFVRFSRDGGRLFVGAGDTLHVYRIHRKLLERVSSLETNRRRYSNAKVVLVGESGIGKSCLAHRLAEGRWYAGESTHGMRVWPLHLPAAPDEGIEREAWLWDLAGQPDYRLIHQIFLDETSLALVLFDPADRQDPFHGIKHWEMALRQAVGREPVKILVASKTDVNSVAVSRPRIEEFIAERGYAAYVQTSAFTGRGRDELLAAVTGHIPWDRTPSITTPRLFKVLKDGIVRIKEQDLVTIQFAALRQQLQLSHPRERFDEADLRTVVRLLASQGVILPVRFGDVILLRPELMNNYAAAVVRAAREHAEGIGCIGERSVLAGDFDFQGMARVSRAEEDILLRAVVETFVERALCIRQETSEGDVLVFPSHYNREPELGEEPCTLVVYRFAGNVTTIYATLVVRLRYTGGFEEPAIYKNAAIFRTNDGHRLGFFFQAEAEGTGKLKLFFDPGVADDTRVTFIRYVHEHLQRHAVDIERQRLYVCPRKDCGQPFRELQALKARLAKGMSYVRCAYCDGEIPLFDLIERKFREDRFEVKVRELEQRAAINLDNESKEMLLVGHAITTAAEAGQIFRPTPNSDHGIDGEIEFKDDRGRASGRRIYLQLKSGDSYVVHRATDGKSVFTAGSDRHLEYWQSQAYPVFLVHRNSEGETFWMNVTDYLRQRADRGSRQIVFSGERFNAFNLLRVANLMLP